MTRPKPVVLIILDGWGHAPPGPHNAITGAATPVWERLLRDYPHGLIHASELQVGLPEGQMGNSEVGHMNIGSGRVLMQELPKIDAAIADGSLARHPKLTAFIGALKKSGGTAHLLGLLSPGGVHSHQRHLAALANIIAGAGVPVAVHAFLDGRDTPPQSALEYLAEFARETAHPLIRIATLSGRYYAMDRDKRWERVEKAYKIIVDGHYQILDDLSMAVAPVDAILSEYEDGRTDEFIYPTSIDGYACSQEYQGMRNGDGLLMANFRADRAREILSALLDPGFQGFERKRTIAFAAALGMVEYSREHRQWMEALFPPEPLANILGEIVSKAGLTQLRIAETEKYAHVTFFFNGGKEQEFPGESRILVPSPKVATYDEKPEMSAFEVAEHVVNAVREGAHDLIIVNFANTDMVGHTGDMKAAIRAVEAVDKCLGRILDAVEAAGGALLVTADHGNAEMMHDDATGQAHTAHTLHLVPAIVAAPALRGHRGKLPEGKLADIAPTILDLLELPKPAEMTGMSLISALR